MSGNDSGNRDLLLTILCGLAVGTPWILFVWRYFPHPAPWRYHVAAGIGGTIFGMIGGMIFQTWKRRQTNG